MLREQQRRLIRGGISLLRSQRQLGLASRSSSGTARPYSSIYILQRPPGSLIAYRTLSPHCANTYIIVEELPAICGERLIGSANSFRCGVIVLLIVSAFFLALIPAYAYAVTFKTNPTSAGSITVGVSTYTNGQTGSYSGNGIGVSVYVPTDYQLVWTYGNRNPGGGSEPSGVYVPNIMSNPTTMDVNGNGWIRAEFSAKVTFYTSPSDQGSISWGSCSNTGKTNGQSTYEANLAPVYSGQVTACANTPSGYTFTGWSCGGGLSCSGSSTPTTVGITGPGTITATFTSSSYTVTFKTNPTSFVGSAGSITIDSSSTYTNGQTGSYTGTHNVNVNVPSDYQFFWVFGNRNPPQSDPTGVYVPNISVNPTTMDVNGNGWLKATYSAKVTFYTNPSDQGSISWGSCANPGKTNGQTTYDPNLPPDYSNSITACANPPTNYKLSGWSCTGGLSCSGSSTPTTVGITGPGTITATFVPNTVAVTATTYVQPTTTYTYATTWRAYLLFKPETWTRIGGTTPSSPNTAWFNGRLYLFVRDTGSGIWMRSMDTSGVWSSSWTRVTGTTPSSPSSTVFNGRLYLFVRDTGSGIWMRSMDTSGVWSSSWTRVTGSTPSTPSSTAGGVSRYIVVVANNGELWIRMSTASLGAYGDMPVPDAPSYTEASASNPVGPVSVVALFILVCIILLRRRRR